MKMGHHACPTCGMMHGGKGAYGGMEGMLDHRMIVKKAMKKILIEKTKARLEARWGEKLDAIAQEYVEMAEQKMNMKKEMWKRKQEMKEHLYSIMAEETEEE